jgi:hypothetical protein
LSTQWAEISDVRVRSSVPKAIVHDATANGDVQWNNPTRKNLILNGGVTVTQAGTTFTAPADGTHVLDVWKVSSADGGGAAPTVDVKRSTTSPFTRIPYSIELDITNVGTADAGRYWYITQKLPDATLYQGKTITVSVMVKASTSLALNTGGRFRVRDDQATTSVSIDTLTTTWETYSLTHTVDTAAAWIQLEFGMLGNNVIGGDDSIYLAVPTMALGIDQGWFDLRETAEEQNLVHYIYERINAADDDAICDGSLQTTTSATGILHFVPKRTTPTITESGEAHFQIKTANTDRPATATAFSGETKQSAIITLTIGGGDAGTAGDGGIIKSHNASAYIDIDARP